MVFEEAFRDSYKKQSKEDLKYGSCVGGFILKYVLTYIGSLIMAQSLNNGFGSDKPCSYIFLISISFWVFQFLFSAIYCFIIVKLYQDDRICYDFKLLSFFNGLFVGIWGLLLTYNMRKNKHGIVQYVIGILYIIMVISIIACYWNAISYYWFIDLDFNFFDDLMKGITWLIMKLSFIVVGLAPWYLICNYAAMMCWTEYRFK